MIASTGRGTFSERVVTLFVTSIATAGIGMFNAFLFARLLGPGAKGDYYLLVLIPNTVLVLVQFGLPSALGFYAARGRTNGIVRRAVTLAVSVSLLALAAVIVLFPVLRDALLKDLPEVLIAASLAVIPALVIATFTSGILIALKAVRWYSLVVVTQAIVSSVLLVTIIGILGLGVEGAIVTYLIAATLGMSLMWFGAGRANRTAPRGPRITYRELFRYGLPLYPGSLTTFFSYRADVFLVAALLPDPSAALGFYSMAVTLAELAAFVPSAVSSVFLPHVAGSRREDADRQVALVARVTLLLTVGTALLIAPVGTLLITLILPAFGATLPALYVLLPAVVSLALAKVIAEYVSGLGKTGTTSTVTIIAFVINIAANVILIPVFGIVGAATASLISYTVSAVLFTIIASHLSSAPLHAFWIPRPSDVGFIIRTGRDLLRRLVGARRRAPEDAQPPQG